MSLLLATPAIFHKTAGGGGGTTYDETWAGGLVNGDAWADLAARTGEDFDTWTRSSTGMQVDFATNANAPSGIAAKFYSSTGTDRYATAGGITSALASWTTLTVTGVFDCTGIGNFAVFGIGYRTSSTVFTGMRIRNGSGATDLDIGGAIAEDISSWTGSNIVSNVDSTTRRNFEILINGSATEIRLWDVGGSRPSAADVSGAAASFTDLHLYCSTESTGVIVEELHVTVT